MLQRGVKKSRSCCPGMPERGACGAVVGRVFPPRVPLAHRLPEPCWFSTFKARCSHLRTSICWRGSLRFMGSLSAAISLSKTSIRSALLTVTANVVSLKVISEANCSAQHLHSPAFFFLFFLPFTSISGPFSAFQLCASH